MGTSKSCSHCLLQITLTQVIRECHTLNLAHLYDHYYYTVPCAMHHLGVQGLPEVSPREGDARDPTAAPMGEADKVRVFPGPLWNTLLGSAVTRSCEQSVA